MNILVTGGAGFIGSHFIRHLIKQRQVATIINYDVLTYAADLRALSDITSDSRYHFVKGDIVDDKTIETLIRKYHITHIINFAAESHVDRSIQDATAFYHSNVLGVVRLLKVLETLPKIRFLQVSTDEVYGPLKTTDKPVTEIASINPTSPYAASKAAGDLFVMAHYRTFKTAVLIARAANNYGPNQHWEKFIPKTIIRVQNDQSIPIYGTGEQIWDWLFVTDNCEALYRILINGTAGEIYNISAKQEKQNITVAELICQRLKKPLNRIEHVTDRLGHDYRYAMAPDKLTRELGWGASVTFTQGLNQTIAWYSKQLDSILKNH